MIYFHNFFSSPLYQNLFNSSNTTTEKRLFRRETRPTPRLIRLHPSQRLRFPVPLPPCQLRLPPWPLRGGKPSPGFEDFQAKFKGEPHNSTQIPLSVWTAAFFRLLIQLQDVWPKPGGSGTQAAVVVGDFVNLS